jgi:hypothetical protein
MDTDPALLNVSGKTESIIDAPASTWMIWPVTKLASSRHSSITALPMSSGGAEPPHGYPAAALDHIRGPKISLDAQVAGDNNLACHKTPACFC